MRTSAPSTAALAHTFRERPERFPGPVAGTLGTGPMSCVFCEIVAGRAPASVIYEDDVLVAFMGIQPTAPGECLVIPKAHVDHFTDVPDEVAQHIIVAAQH